MRATETDLDPTRSRRAILSAIFMTGTALCFVPDAKAQTVLHTFPTLRYFGGMSLDGGVFAGTARDDIYSDKQAYIGRYSNGTYSLEPLGNLGGANTLANGVSGDGSTVVGEAENVDGAYRAFRASTSGGALQDLGTLTPTLSGNSYALGVSHDGTRVVGYSTRLGTSHAFVWIEGASHGVTDNEQMFQLSELAGGYGRSEASAISGNGNYAVGYSDAAATTNRAVRWDLSGLTSGAGDVVLDLGTLAGTQGWSEARAVSFDGRSVVGSAENADGYVRAFLWREGASHGSADNPEMLDLGTLGGNSSYGTGISSNGEWVVGDSSDVLGLASIAFRWSETTGMEAISDWLERHGVDLGGLYIAEAGYISDDGTIVGGVYTDATNQSRVYIARAEGPDSGMLDVADYHQSLTANASVASAGEFISWLPLNGAHHRPLLAQPEMGGNHCMWTTTDLAHHSAARTTIGLSEVGACVDPVDGVRLGASVGTSHAWQTLVNDGSAQVGGYYLVGEADWQPRGLPVIFSLTGMAGRWDVDVRRGYMNGARIDYSRGKTRMTGAAVRARVDWLEAATFGNTTINPFASVALGRTHLGGYTETGGAFPASFNAQTNTTREVRLGLTAVSEISEQMTLSTTLEGVHRSGDSPSASGNVPGLFNFGLGGGGFGNAWVRAGAELDFRLSDAAVVSASFNLATAGRDASVSGSLGLRGHF